jgi:hypothetical protein
MIARTRASLAPIVLDLAVVLLTLALFWPLTRIFFAQDDFVLIEKARQGFGASIGYFFENEPGQFRPLTKGLYFLLGDSVFGLHPTPYHIKSILMHALCAILLGVALRRTGVAAAPSRFAAAVFAFSMTNMEAVAWIACVQQLLGAAFLLATITLGIVAVERRGRFRPATLLAYALALASYEQALAAPLVILFWVAMRRGAREAVRVTREWGWMLLAMLAAYLVFMLAWKGIPRGGPYAMSVGAHVLENLRAYTAMVYSPWLVLPAYGTPAGLTASHVLEVAIIGFLLERRRSREVVFGLSTFVLLLAPVLFTSEHVHTFHLYVPAIGPWFLLALVFEELAAILPRRAARLRGAGLAVLAATCFIGSGVALHRNISEPIAENVPLPRSFVLRRALLAERMWNCLRAKTDPRNAGGRLVLVYRQPQYRANWVNIHSALGQGSAVRLALDQPNLDVVFAPPSELPPDVKESELFFYTEAGECRRLAEMETR